MATRPQPDSSAQPDWRQSATGRRLRILAEQRDEARAKLADAHRRVRSLVARGRQLDPPLTFPEMAKALGITKAVAKAKLRGAAVLPEHEALEGPEVLESLAQARRDKDAARAREAQFTAELRSLLRLVMGDGVTGPELAQFLGGERHYWQRLGKEE